MRSMASTTSSKGIAAIVGVGPNLGRCIARKFAHEGYTVAILAPDLGRLSKFADEIAREEKAQVFAIRIDCAESKSVRGAFEGVLSLGFVEVLVYNAYHPVSNTDSFTDISFDSFQKSLAVSSLGAFLCAQQVLPGMVGRGRGTILFTGCSASLNGIAGFPALCCGKFALRALSQCLAKEFQPLGIHVAHVVIDGVVGSARGSSSSSSSSRYQRTSVGEQHSPEQSGCSSSGGEGSTVMMDPDSLAQTYWHLHVQDRTAWTQEIDLRPSNFRFY
ncbi:adh_short domain-containing protein [Cephalotus follicularis]|uniref:Adh_short domain-containing protein n=1 Tax=Cephalotus follicularis TaxID=3775 RepID=A0A1Q3BWW1_CEPFO|nr:adh_short domain-containing protein [Cephalotus follicularis]